MHEYSLKVGINKSKLLKNLLLSLLFVGAGIWILLAKPQTGNPVFNDPVFKYGAAVVCIIFFGLVALWITRRLFSKRPGLVVSNKGIINQSTLSQGNFIGWHEIESFVRTRIRKQDFMLVKLKDPQAYIAKHSKNYRQRMLKHNYETQGTPVSILLSSLDCKANELEEFLNEELNTYGKKSSVQNR